MRQITKLSYVTIGLIFFICGIYFNGCTTMESTTGKLAYQQKDYEKAVRELSKGLETDKTDDEGWYMLGYSQVEIGKYDDAQKSFKTCLSISDKFAQNIKFYWAEKYNFGINSFNDGTKSLGKKDSVMADKYFHQSINYFKASTAIIPDSIISYQMIGDAYNYLGKTDSALFVYTSILDKSKSKADAIMIANLFYKAGMRARANEQWDQALDMFQKATEVNYLPKENIYYQASLFNLGYANYQIAAKIAADTSHKKSDYKPNLQKCVDILEPLPKIIQGNKTTLTDTEKSLLTTTYDVLYNAYDGLGMDAKRDEVKKKKEELQK